MRADRRELDNVAIARLCAAMRAGPSLVQIQGVGPSLISPCSPRPFDGRTLQLSARRDSTCRTLVRYYPDIDTALHASSTLSRHCSDTTSTLIRD